MISIIVATKNRPRLLLKNISSILNNTFIDYEIIIVDQSDFFLKNQYDCVSKLSPKISLYTNKERGKSAAINYGIKKAKGTIVAFTDDDCIVDKNWLMNIYKAFSNVHIDAVFGDTYPYQSFRHRDKFCPSTMYIPEHTIYKPEIHYTNIGFGNNMAIRKSLIRKIGLFKTWLGPGTIGMAAMDADYIIRILRANYTILHSNKLIVYHNKWQTAKEAESQKHTYMCGEVACYGYYAILGESIAKQVCINNFTDSFRELKHSCKKMIQSKRFDQKLNKEAINFFFRLKGFVIGIVYYCKENLL